MHPPPPGASYTNTTTLNDSSQKTYLIIGASRGIGLEFCRQLLAAHQRVIATARAATGASQLWALTGTPNGRNLSILECDVADEESVGRFVGAVGVEMGRRVAGGGGGKGFVGGVLGGYGVKGPFGGEGDGVIDVCVVNAGVLVYPNRVLGITYSQFAHHLTTNTIGPLLTAAALLKTPITFTSTSPTTTTSHPPITTLRIRTLVFMSSDSGSAARFRAFEDGFAAYAASKSALNQGLRHLAAELPRLPPPPSSPLTLPAPIPSPAISPGYGISSPTTTTTTTIAGGGGGGGLYFPPLPHTTTTPTSNTPPAPPQNQHQHQHQHPNARTVILALHPGEVATDMASATSASASSAAVGGDLAWEVEGIISPEESVRGMLRVIADKGWAGGHERGGQPVGVATFWDWEGRPYPW